jgi:hypothetical protein
MLTLSLLGIGSAALFLADTVRIHVGYRFALRAITVQGRVGDALTAGIPMALTPFCSVDLEPLPVKIPVSVVRPQSRRRGVGCLVTSYGYNAKAGKVTVSSRFDLRAYAGKG